MADQEFLASFGVDIDENGVSRLQKILGENRTLAQSLAESFTAAAEGVRAFRDSIASDLPSLFSGYGNVTENAFGAAGGLRIGLDLTEANKELKAFTAAAKKPVYFSANASGIVSAARTALENVRSLFGETFTLNVRAETDRDGGEDRDTSLGMTRMRMSAGGRFSKPTSVKVAEDGDAEYIIPVKKEGRALPLLRQLLGELSPEARESLMPSAAPASDTGPASSTGQSSYAIPTASPVLSTGAAGGLEKSLSAFTLPNLSAAQPSSPSVTQDNRSVSAPVTINVKASGTDPEAVGETIYDTAERYLLRTLQGVF